jgi:hypothetical protein
VEDRTEGLLALLAMLALAGFVLLGMVMMIAPRLRSRRKPKQPAVMWIPDARPQEVRLRSYADELLDEIGIAAHLRREVDRKVAAPALDDYAAEIAAIEQFARKKGLS